MKTLTLLPACFFSSCLLFLLVSSLCSFCFCNQSSDPALCIPTERSALIDLRSNLTDHANRLSSWVGKDCCSWSGVVCDNITGHVHEIHLRGPHLFNWNHMIGGSISPSVINLLQLRYLDLSCNDFGRSSIPAFIGSFQNLIYLNLSYSNFSGEIPHQLGNLSTLHVLDLSGDIGAILSYSSFRLVSKSLAWLKNIKGLQYLDIARASDWFLSVSNLTSLQELHFSDCGLNQLPSNPTTGSFMSLNALDLSYNLFENALPGWIFSLRNLTLLDLSGYSISGVLSGTHGGFHSMPSLRTLRLIETTFVNSSSLLNGLSGLSNLRFLDLSFCDISSPILGNLQNLSFIEYVDLSDNRIVEEIPKSLSNLCNITTLDLHSNNFFGNVSELLEGFCECESPKLEVLDLSFNQLTGAIPESIGQLSKLYSLQLQNNSLTGILPSNYSTTNILDLSNNRISGSLEQFLCSGIQEPQPLEFLNLANNKMSGVISDCWKNFGGLIILNLEKNRFSGIIPSSLGNISSLRSLEMDENRLYGNLPPWLLNSTGLVVIKLAENELVGKIPSSIGRNNTSLRVLSLRSNKLEGKIPDEICHLSSLQILDLAHNDLSGNLPTCFTNFSVMSGRETSGPIYLYRATIITASLVTKGNTYTYSTILYQVTTLDLSSNKFSGPIPDELVRLLGLRFLNLSHNDLTGTIPDLFNQIGKLESLDLSMNHLNGNIPLTLSHLTALNWLNVSCNNLVGGIPTGPQFQTFNESSFTGNALCGDPLPACLLNNGSTEGITDGHGEADGVDWILVIVTLAGLVVGFWIILAPLFISRRWRITYYCFLEEIWFKLQNFIFRLFLRRY
ncbi:uncharacterized protein LOC143632298 [Bidens hawaiensis]|uniref:uncharacterized protein LOC143632298 n=1 Tax=Bidens hawaiensis TaxID=980011 RepID=UPI0040495154